MNLTQKHAELIGWLDAAIKNDFIRTVSIIDRINVWWNVNIDYTKDEAERDTWQTPAETLERGEGDCEDIAIGKYFDLKTLGLKPVMVFALMDNNLNIGHIYCECDYEKLDCQDALCITAFTFDGDEIIVEGNEIKIHPFVQFPQWKRVVEAMEKL